MAIYKNTKRKMRLKPQVSDKVIEAKANFDKIEAPSYFEKTNILPLTSTNFTREANQTNIFASDFMIAFMFGGGFTAFGMAIGSAMR